MEGVEAGHAADGLGAHRAQGARGVAFGVDAEHVGAGLGEAPLPVLVSARVHFQRVPVNVQGVPGDLFFTRRRVVVGIEREGTALVVVVDARFALGLELVVDFAGGRAAGLVQKVVGVEQAGGEAHAHIARGPLEVVVIRVAVGQRPELVGARNGRFPRSRVAVSVLVQEGVTLPVRAIFAASGVVGRPRLLGALGHVEDRGVQVDVGRGAVGVLMPRRLAGNIIRLFRHVVDDGGRAGIGGQFDVSRAPIDFEDGVASFGDNFSGFQRVVSRVGARFGGGVEFRRWGRRWGSRCRHRGGGIGSVGVGGRGVGGFCVHHARLG